MDHAGSTEQPLRALGVFSLDSKGSLAGAAISCFLEKVICSPIRIQVPGLWKQV